MSNLVLVAERPSAHVPVRAVVIIDTIMKPGSLGLQEVYGGVRLTGIVDEI